MTSSCNEIGRFEELKEKVNQECMRLLWAKTKEAGEQATETQTDTEEGGEREEPPAEERDRERERGASSHDTLLMYVVSSRSV